MATAPVARKLNLTRDQLATFLTDQQQIRQFELLFATVDTIAPDVVNEVSIAAGSAQATANEALAQIEALAQVVALDGSAEVLSYLAELSKQIQALESAPPFSAPPAVIPAGSNTQIQFNNNGAFGASANFTYATGTNTFTVGPAGATTIIETLAPTGATVAGTMRFLGKNASATNGNGGGFQYAAGNASGTGTGGGHAFSCGTGQNGGSISFVSANGTVNGGSMAFNAGQADASGLGGGFSMTAGLGLSSASGGSFELLAGAADTGSGGGFALLAGSSSGGGVGGDLQISAGFGVPSGNVYIGTDSNSACLTITEDGSAASQMGFFNVAPVTQPTTATGSATFVVNSGGSIHPTSTFDGYTLAQVVRALRDLGILA